MLPRWMEKNIVCLLLENVLINKFGGNHHDSLTDKECMEAFKYAEETDCIIS